MVYLSLSASISSFNPFGLNAFALCNILLELLSFKKLSWTSVFPPCSYQSLVVFWLNFYTMKFSRFCWPGPCPEWQLIYLTTLSLLCQELFLNFFPLSVASFLRCLSLRQLDYIIIFPLPLSSGFFHKIIVSSFLNYSEKSIVTKNFLKFSYIIYVKKYDSLILGAGKEKILIMLWNSNVLPSGFFIRRQFYLRDGYVTENSQVLDKSVNRD